MPWDYEPEGYEWSGNRYVPDFYLPTLRVRKGQPGTYIEVRPDDDGIFKLSNDRTQIAFLIAPEGIVDKTVLMGTGFISALAPTVSADSPVWVSPITIEVNGDFIKYTSTLAV